MCFGYIKRRNHIHCVYPIDSDNSGSTSEENIPQNLPEHSDNPFTNTNLSNGILGFRYENKVDGLLVVYTSIEAKTLCKLMKLTPLKKHT